MLKVGDALTNTLTGTFHVPKCGGCHEVSKKMNELGVDGCREQLEELAESLHQNAKHMKWKSLMEAAVNVVDAVTHPVAGNHFYRQLIIDAIEQTEAYNARCIHVGRRQGFAPWNKGLERFECSSDKVKYRFCIISGSRRDGEQAPRDGLAVCTACPHKEFE